LPSIIAKRVGNTGNKVRGYGGWGGNARGGKRTKTSINLAIRKKRKRPNRTQDYFTKDRELTNGFFERRISELKSKEIPRRGTGKGSDLRGGETLLEEVALLLHKDLEKPVKKEWGGSGKPNRP